MSIETLRIPQLGEGLHEAMLVEYLCQPGSWVKRDQPIYVLETDKATTEVESPVEGRLVAWLVEPGQTLPIGFEIGRIESEVPTSVSDQRELAAPEAAIEAEVRGLAEEVSPRAELRAEVDDQRRFRVDVGNTSAVQGLKGPHRRRREDGVKVPPRTLRHLRSLGVTEQLDRIPSRNGKLMPEDVDRYLATGQDVSSAPRRTDSLPSAYKPEVRPVQPVSESPLQSTGWYDEHPVPKDQLVLNYRLLRGLQQVVPATAIVEVDWTRIAAARAASKAQGGPTGFLMMLWCVAQSLASFPALRSTLVRDGRVMRTFKHVDLGIAVALPDDRLVTAVVPQADTLSQSQFWAAAADRIALARSGRDQANDRVTFTVSNVGTFGLQAGVPVVVPPAVATMALGEVQPRPIPDGDSWRFQQRATIGLTFDHRILNGLGAGRFLADLGKRISEFTLQ